MGQTEAFQQQNVTVQSSIIIGKVWIVTIVRQRYSVLLSFGLNHGLKDICPDNGPQRVSFEECLGGESRLSGIVAKRKDQRKDDFDGFFKMASAILALNRK